MSKSNNIQPGHNRHYRETGKTIEVNGGVKPHKSIDPSGFLVLIQLIVGIVVFIWAFNSQG
jgi:hypothetical protein